MLQKTPLAIVLLSAVFALPLLMATQAEAKTAIVHIKDRTTPMRGELVSESSDAIVLKIANIPTTIEKSRIERIEYELSPVEKFQEQLQAIDDDAHEKRYMLAREAFDNVELLPGQRLALDQAIAAELQSLTKAAPDMEQAKILLELTQTRIREAREEAAEQAADNNARPTRPTPQNQQQAAQATDELPVLNDKQRNLLKVYEINTKNKPRVVVPNDTLNKLLDEYRSAPALSDYIGPNGEARLKRMDGYEQLSLLFDVKARNLYDEVIIRDEPKVLQAWRTKYNPRMVVGYFARYFDAEQIPGFRIHDQRANREAEAYTNYYIIRNLEVDNRPLIDLNRPRESVLVQWALPRDSATFPAPQVKGWRPYFTGLEDPRLREFESWIQSIFTRDYPIQYQLPNTEEPEAAAEAEDEEAAEQPQP
jgi:hypothetical protein